MGDRHARQRKGQRKTVSSCGGAWLVRPNGFVEEPEKNRHKTLKKIRLWISTSGNAELQSGSVKFTHNISGSAFGGIQY
jgi:hypothetical protein